MKTADQTLDEILNLAAAHFKVPREKLSPDDDFFKTLGIDSLQTLDLLTRLEHHFHVELPDYELKGGSDFPTLASRLKARCAPAVSAGGGGEEEAKPADHAGRFGTPRSQAG